LANREEIILEVKTKFEELKALRNSLTALKKELSKSSFGGGSFFEEMSKTHKEIGIQIDNIRRTLSNIRPGTDLDKIKNKFDEITSSAKKLNSTLTETITKASTFTPPTLTGVPTTSSISKSNLKLIKDAEKERIKNEKQANAEIVRERKSLEKELSKQQKEHEKTLSTLDSLTNRPVAKDIVSGKDTVGEFVTNLKGNVSHAKEAVIELKKVLSTDLPSAIKNPLQKELKKYEGIASGLDLEKKWSPSLVNIPKLTSDQSSSLTAANQNLVKSFNYAAWRDETNKTINYNKDKLNQLKEGLKSLNKEGGANVKELVAKTKNEISSMNNILAGHSRGWKAMADSIIGNTTNMIKMQAQWYTAKALVFFPVEQMSKGVKAFIEWQQSVTDVKAASNATAIEMEKVKKTSLEISTTTPVSSEKAAKSMFEFAQAGMDVNTMQKASLVAAKLVTITHEDMADAVTALTKIYSVWKVESQDMTGVGDKLAASLADSRLKVKDLSTLFNYLAQTGGLAKISLTDILTLSTALSKAGAEPSTIGTGLSSLISRLLNPEQFKKLAKTFGPKLKEAGLSLKDITLTQDNNIINIIKNFEKAGFTAKDFMTGLELRTGRAASGLLLLSDQIDKIKETIETKGKTKLMFDISMEGIENKLKLIDNNFKNIFIRLGDQSTGFVSSILDEFNQVILALNILTMKASEAEIEFKKLNTTGKITYDVFKTIGDIFGGVGASLSPLIELLSSLTKNLGFAGEGTSLLTKIITTGLIAALLSKIKWLTTSITLLSEFGAIFTGTGGLIAVITGFTKVLSKLWGLASTKIFTVLVFFEVADWIQEYNKKGLKEAQGQAELPFPLPSEKYLKGKTLEQKIKRKKGDIKALEENVKLQEGMAKYYRSGENPLPKAINAAENLANIIAKPYLEENIAETHDVAAKKRKQQIKEEEENLSKLLEQEKGKKQGKETSTGGGAETGKRKELMGRNWALEKKEAEIKLKEIDLLDKDYFAELENKRKLGFISEEEYTAQSINRFKESSKQKLAIELEVENYHTSELALIRDEDLKKEKLSADDKKRIWRQYELGIQEIDLKKKEIKSKYNVETIQKETDLALYQKELFIRNSNLLLDVEANKKKQSIDLLESKSEKEAEIRKFLYDKNLISAKSYYDKEFELINISINRNIEKARIERDLEVNKQKLIIEKSPKSKEAENANIAIQRANEKFSEEEIKLNDTKTKRIQKLELEKADIIKALWTGEDGVTKTTQKALIDLLNSWKTFGEQWYEMIQGTMQSITTTMSDVFFDAMEGKLKSAEDYWESFASSVKRILANMFAQDMVQMLFGMSAKTGQLTGGGLFGSLLGALGLGSIGTASTTSEGIIGGTEATYSFAHSGGLIKYHNGGTIGLKRLHIGGLMPDERVIVGQTGEGVVSRSGMKTLEQINNGSMSSRKVSSPIINNFNIQTMDAQSFSQFAYNNKSIFAAAIQAGNNDNSVFRRSKK
jgi:TP901 family phage tail tape measure protein